jgi:cytochrome c-type biogenesis protein CcmF
MAVVEPKNNKFFEKIANKLLIAQTVMVTATVGVLLHLLVTSNFRYEYVAMYTDSNLPLLYKLTALWAGQAGSLLFWAWLAALFGAFEIWRIRAKDSKYKVVVFAAMAATTSFFLYLGTVVTPTFAELPFFMSEGRGMNPMLQNPGMIIHPPLLYIGFVGFTLPFAHALASCFVKDVSTYWVASSRPWIMFTWVFLTAGIVLGAWWAYVELGWGGYWAWDPVENASLFPWITATALIHAALIYERKGRLKSWTYVMVLVTFELTIFGTYLTRSGIMTDSVHSFGTSPLGGYFLAFMIVTMIAYIWGMILNSKNLFTEQQFNFTSKEGVFFIALLLFSALTLALIIYTMLPVITSNLGKIFPGIHKVSVQTNSYNLVSIPFFAGLFLLAGIAPIIGYGKSELSKFLKGYIPVLIIALLAVVLMIGLKFVNPIAIVLTFTAVTAMAAFLLLGLRSIKNAGIMAIFRFRRLFGAIIIHLGLGMVALGVIFSALFSYQSAATTVAPYGTLSFGPYDLKFETVEREEVNNYVASYVPVEVSKDGEFVTTLYPEIRSYYMYNDELRKVALDEKRPFAEVAYQSMWHGDLYLILEGYDLGRGIINIKAIFQPLIIWIWVGSIVMCIGGLYGLTQRPTITANRE